MNISQKIIGEKWIVTISFGAFTFTNGNGPFFIAGDFNNWKVEDDNYKIHTPPHGGANSLLDFKLGKEKGSGLCLTHLICKMAMDAHLLKSRYLLSILTGWFRQE